MKQKTWQERFDENKFSWYYKDTASGFCFLNEKEIKSFIASELSALAKEMIEIFDESDLEKNETRYALMEVLEDNNVNL
ncbi:TPA: hypothetical protein DIU22_03680 [Candidatus Woesebacteria bacterium]|nr:hypothetical protein [Candidatus Woesebacteria bacterium]